MQGTPAPPSLVLVPRDFNRGDGRGGEGLPESGHPIPKQVVFLVGRIFRHLGNALPNVGSSRLKFFTSDTFWQAFPA
ncbi:MAG: hypothetical protein LBT01_05775, partial [Spirochaetaceae bacterium]|nr:hypothetical protein [Spirochaetaceae bacterium]